jgi:hypothetical protein
MSRLSTKCVDKGNLSNEEAGFCQFQWKILVGSKISIPQLFYFSSHIPLVETWKRVKELLSCFFLLVVVVVVFLFVFRCLLVLLPSFFKNQTDQKKKK